jgi:hypothetical protein
MMYWMLIFASYLVPSLSYRVALIGAWRIARSPEAT